jgi:hypothetical protein
MEKIKFDEMMVLEKARKLGSKDQKPRKKRAILPYHMTKEAQQKKETRESLANWLKESRKRSPLPYLDAIDKINEIHGKYFKSDNYVIKADVPEGNRSHKAYSRTVGGKQQQIKQKGAPGAKDKEPNGKNKIGDKAEGSAQVGHVIMVGQEPAKVTAVGKDGVTATDDKGDKHLIRHANVEPGNGNKEKEEKGISDKEEEDNKESSFKKPEKKDHPVIDEFKSMYDSKKVEKTWMVPDPKIDGVYLIFTREKTKDSPYKAHIFYRADEDFETIDDVSSAIKKYGPENLKVEFEKKSSSKNKPEKSEKKGPPGSSKEAKEGKTASLKRELGRLEEAYEQETNIEQKGKLKKQIADWKDKISNRGEKTEKSMDQFIISLDDDVEKAQVRGYTRTRRGKLERVDPFSRKGEKKIKRLHQQYGNRFVAPPDHVEVVDEFHAYAKQQHDDITVDNAIQFMDYYEAYEDLTIPERTKNLVIKQIQKEEDDNEKLHRETTPRAKAGLYRRIQSIANAIYDNDKISPLHKRDATVQKHAKRLAAAGVTASRVRQMDSKQMLTTGKRLLELGK